MKASGSFAAPWGMPLKLMTSLGVTAVVGVLVGLACAPGVPSTGIILAWAFLPLVLIGSALTAVRGFAVTPDALQVRRLCWTTEIPLRHLQQAEVISLRKNGVAVRVFGNGGLFSFSGWYWSRALGRFRLFGTDLSRTVLLRFDDRAVVVTPDRPEDFVATVRSLRNLTPLSPRL